MHIDFIVGNNRSKHSLFRNMAVRQTEPQITGPEEILERLEKKFTGYEFRVDGNPPKVQRKGVVGWYDVCAHGRQACRQCKDALKCLHKNQKHACMFCKNMHLCMHNRKAAFCVKCAQTKKEPLERSVTPVKPV
jgi:hypothetical protein